MGTLFKNQILELQTQFSVEIKIATKSFHKRWVSHFPHCNKTADKKQFKGGRDSFSGGGQAGLPPGAE